MLKFRDSAFKHGISKERIDQVLSDFFSVTYIGEDMVVFHAARATFYWRVKHREES